MSDDGWKVGDRVTRYRIRPMRPGVDYKKWYARTLEGARAIAHQHIAPTYIIPAREVWIEKTDDEPMRGRYAGWEHVETIRGVES